MTELLERAVATANLLSAEAQDEIAHMILAYADRPVLILTPDEVRDLAEADEEIARGAFASDDAVQALWSKHGR